MYSALFLWKCFAFIVLFTLSLLCILSPALLSPQGHSQTAGQAVVESTRVPTGAQCERAQSEGGVEGLDERGASGSKDQHQQGLRIPENI